MGHNLGFGGKLFRILRHLMTRMARLAWVTGLTLVPIAAAQAVQSARQPVAFSDVVQVVLGLVVVVAMIVGAAWAIRKGGKITPGGRDGLRVVTGISIGVKEKIVIVQAEHIRLLIGVTPSQIQTLYVLGEGGDPQEVDMKGEEGSFMERLRQQIRERGLSI